MSQLRKDTLTGRWVIMAADRQGRPNEFDQTTSTPAGPEDCPFCPGHENRTTPEILATGRLAHEGGKQSQWRVRVFPNMYPALVPVPTGPENSGPGQDLFPEAAGRGDHEVVVYTPDHAGSLGSLSAEHLGELLLVIRDRVRTLAANLPVVRHVLPFCNHGPQAGATLAHPHLQILAAPLVPALVLEKAANLAFHHDRTGRCLLCDTLAAEIRDGRRIIQANAEWVALAPWASRFPFEMRLVPRTHAAGLQEASETVLNALGDILKSTLARLEQIHQNLSYNVIIHSGAVRGDGSPAGDAAAGSSFHWHVEVLPRLTRLAGFEAGSGFAINSIAPETAAARLRGEG